jgi:hypothetical protein
MDFADSPEHANSAASSRLARRQLPDDLKVEDARDQRISRDRDILRSALPGRRGCTPPAGWGFPGPRSMAGAALASCNRSSMTRSISAPAGTPFCLRQRARPAWARR